ncbi:MAG: ABA4-like family protein, partial [Longimicrobiales bacterium]
MYRTLFDMAGFAILGWLPLILAPTWKVTRRIAESAIFPAYLAVIYAVGVVAVLSELGPGIMADFGSAEGVLGLLRMESVALVAWIHILVFDQVVAILIYRDNLRHRFLPLPLQSVLLVLTLMFGPLGFLAYWLVRMWRGGRVAWGERGTEPDVPAQGARGATAKDAAPVRFGDVVVQRSVAGATLGLWRRERVLVGFGSAGLVLAAICLAVAAFNGGWLLEPEGRLREAVKFDIAFGIYWLSLALLVPLAGFTPRGRKRWVAWSGGLLLYSYAMENVQTWRGLDPRFSTVAGLVDQILGIVFFVTALGVMTLFIILMLKFFRRDALPDHPALRLALRYAGVAALIAFGAGIVMSGVSGRFVNGAGNIMPLHAAGFHGLQALPLVALLLGWSGMPAEASRSWVHVAGSSWLLFCLGLIVQ